MSRDAHSAAVLSLVLGNGHALDIAAVSHGDDHVFFLDKVFYVDVAVVVGELGKSWRCVLRLDCGDLVDDNLLHFFIA